MRTFFKLFIFISACFELFSCSDIRTLCSIEQIEDDIYLFEMNYSAGYDLENLVKSDIDSNGALEEYVVSKLSRGLVKADIKGCTTFHVKNADGDGYLFGRNYDFAKNPSLVLHSKPKAGYASVSVCDLSHLGYSLDKVPAKFKDRLFTLAAIYAPMDGMNEKGLCVSIMALPHQAAYQNAGNHKVGTTTIMRLWLDRCATVDDALSMLDTLDVCHDQDSGGYHYLVADASGECAVVEFDPGNDWKTMIIRKGADSTYMVCTNHLLSEPYRTDVPDERYGNTQSKSWWRYETVSGFIKEHSGSLSVSEAGECLSKVRWVDLLWDNGDIEDTQWSAVYDQSTLTLSLRSWNTYGAVRTFSVFP